MQVDWPKQAFHVHNQTRGIQHKHQETYYTVWLSNSFWKLTSMLIGLQNNNLQTLCTQSEPLTSLNLAK